MARKWMWFRGSRSVRSRRALATGALLSLLGVLACGGPVLEEPPDGWRSQNHALAVGGGLSPEGLAANGLAINGLRTHGLTTHGLSTPQFAAWFDQDPALSAEVMKHVVRCALPAGSSLVWTDSRTGTQYAWNGHLGLAQDWGLGNPASLGEQQLISACLGALTNRYGLNLSVSILGRNARGVPIPQAENESLIYSEAEACFFGNLFIGLGQGLFAANNGIRSPAESSLRGCGLEQAHPPGVSMCPPLVLVGQCRDYCEQHVSGSHYVRCMFNGTSYRPLTTRLRRDNIFSCGDGACQLTESCGTGMTPDNCREDCGICY
ncbi:hypothetical protein ACLESD_31300 [Pyxidicoccus sp. 3LFB2]